MTTHRADCTDCSWSFEGDDAIEVTDAQERHSRKEQHHVEFERAVATDGGREQDIVDPIPAPELDDDGHVETTKACPHCDNSSLARRGTRARGKDMRERDPDKQYYCGQCGRGVDPVEREKKNDSIPAGGTLANELYHADADDVGGDV